MPGLPDADSGNLGLKSAAVPLSLGLGSSIFQILLLREFSATFEGRETAYGLLLAAWLLGGGLGGLWGHRRAGRPEHALRYFEIALLASTLAFAALRLFRPALGILPGEILGPGFMGAAAILLGPAVAFPFGAVFTVAAAGDGWAGRVYFWESAGAAAGGLIASFALIPLFSNWTAAAITGVILLAFVRLAAGPRGGVTPAAAAAALAFAALVLLDGPAQRLAWKPYSLARVEDTRYGKIQIVRTGDQLHFYGDGMRIFTTGDPAAAEEAVHFAMLQAPEAERVLLIGGGTGGDLAEILKYPRTNIDDVEFDPALLRLADRYLPEAERRPLHDARVRLRIEDARAFLARDDLPFDAILADLPAPATIKTNRYYTLEFFRDVRARLRPGGVFGFRVPSAENYLSPALTVFLRSIRATLASVFPEIAIVPGGTNIFLASDRPLSLDPAVLSDRVRRLGLRNRYVNPAMLPSRLDPDRVARLRKAVEEGKGEVNTDARPIGLFRESAVWSAPFADQASGFMGWIGSRPPALLLGFGWLVFSAILLGFRLRRSGSAAILGPLAVLGLTTMAVEIVVIAWFQSVHGSIYENLALLLAAFMAGLAAGSAAALGLRKPRPAVLISLQAGLIGLLIGARAGLGARPSPFVFAMLLFLTGAAAGGIFVLANALFIKIPRRSGLGYAMELLGGFLGAWAITAVLIPLAGLSSVLFWLILLNSASLLSMISLRFGRSG